MENNWQNKTFLVIGAARQGRAAARFLARNGASVILNDAQPAKEFKGNLNGFSELGIKFHLGGHPLSLLEKVDYICVSGGIPLSLPIIRRAIELKIPLTNDSQLFMQETCAKVIGVTGSAGKTTTTMLIGEIAKASVSPDQNVWVGGNIGDPLLNYVEKMSMNDWVVMEISSFQLEQMDISPHIALVVNITPNHLDRHGTFEAYTAAKARIITHQNENDIAVLNLDDPGSRDLFGQAVGKIITFSQDRPELYNGVYSASDEVLFFDGERDTLLMHNSILKLPGAHNLKNAMAACAVAIAAEFSKEAIQSGISNVEGIPHRLELIKKNNGVRWVNDSIATAPERVIAALHVVPSPLILMLGGKDKDLPWEPLAALLHELKPQVILFGEAAGLIMDALKEYEKGKKPSYPVYLTNGFVEAFQKAASIAKAGDTVLLSPGGTSYDAYRDFEERGNHFRVLVEELK